MQLKLRHDLLWSVEADTEDASVELHVLHDPVTGREFAWEGIQLEILRALSDAETIPRLHQRLTRHPELDEESLKAFLGFLDDLCLLASDLSPEEIRARQRERQRRSLQEHQVEALARLVERTKVEIPFYRDWLNLASTAIQDVDDLRKLPLLSKETFRLNFHRFLPENMQGEDIITLSTSGTTGDRLQLVSKMDFGLGVATHTLNINRHIRRILSSQDGLRFCTLTTPICSGTECHVGIDVPLEMRLKEPELILESNHNIISFPTERLCRMVDEINHFRPDYLLGDPVYLAVLAQHVVKSRPRLHPIRFLITTYELCSQIHRQVLEEAFECPLFEVYGTTEFGWVAIQCEEGAYHVADSATILEVLVGDEPAGEGTIGQIVVTTLEKEIMPLIRYETGDLACVAAQPCGCSRSETTTLACIEGRIKDVITAVDGCRVTPKAVDRAVSSAADGFAFYSLVQESCSAYRLLIVPKDGYTESNDEKVRGALRELLGQTASIVVEPRRELRPEPSGKFRLSFQRKPVDPGPLAPYRRAAANQR